ncbi:MAG: hypothetical protein CMM03_03695 [Rhodopirellula sp.]|nr:hypothetical protein [Rhodopirellula sp.]
MFGSRLWLLLPLVISAAVTCPQPEARAQFEWDEATLKENPDLRKKMEKALRDEGWELEKIEEVSKKSTVQVLGYVNGSGVIAKAERDQYEVLTAWHVVSQLQAGEELWVETYDNKQHKVIEAPIRVGASDMAILKFKSDVAYHAPDLAHSEEELRQRSNVFVAGFPIRKSSGKVTTTGGILFESNYLGASQGYDLFYTAETRPGMSGGPVLSIKGNLIGIHGRGERDPRTINYSIDIVKSGVNNGMSINNYLLFENLHKKGRAVVSNDFSDMTAIELGSYANQLSKDSGTARQRIFIGKLMLQRLEGMPEFVEPHAYEILAYAYYQLNDAPNHRKYKRLAIEAKKKESDKFWSNNKLKPGQITSRLSMRWDDHQIIKTIEDQDLMPGDQASLRKHIKNLKKLESKYSILHDINYLKGNMYIDLFDYELAVPEYQLAIQKLDALEESEEKTRTLIHYSSGLVYAYSKAKKYKVAIDHAKNLVGKYSKSAKASQVLVEALLAKSSQPSFEIYPDEEWKLLNESCIQAIDGSEPNSSDKARALADCSQVADMAGKPNMAIQMLNASLTIQPNQQFWLVSRGIIKEGLGKINDACEDYKLAINLDNRVLEYLDYNQICTSYKD